jgi:hypothetical protein
MAINRNNSEFELKFADSLEILTNVEYLWSRSGPVSIEQAGYLRALRTETAKLRDYCETYSARSLRREAFRYFDRLLENGKRPSKRL